MRFRVCGALLATVLAAGTLAGCKTNVGVAASVGGTTISESDVNDQIVAGHGSSVSLGTTSVPAKSFVLQVLVQQRLLERVLAAKGGVPSDGELNSVSGKASELLLGLPAGRATSSLAPRLHQGGIKTSLASRFLRVTELRYELIQRRNIARFGDTTAVIDQAITKTLADNGAQANDSVVRAVAKATSDQLRSASSGSLTEVISTALTTALSQLKLSASPQLIQALVPPLAQALGNEQYLGGLYDLVHGAHIPVSVNPRYGTWDPTALSITVNDKTGVPDFLTVHSAPKSVPSGG